MGERLLTMEPSLQKGVPFVQVTASSILQEVLTRTRSRKNVYVRILRFNLGSSD